MFQRRCFHVGVQVFYGRMLAVGFVGVNCVEGAGGEECVEAEQVKEGALPGLDGFVRFGDSAHDEASRNLFALLLLGSECARQAIETI